MVITLTNAIDVPGNSSRAFKFLEQATSQPRGTIQFGWDYQNPYLRNLKYDASIINYDENYCTSVCSLDTEGVIPTSQYFHQVREVLSSSALVTDVGCGQGEFVRVLRSSGLSAIGFDPVLHEPSEFLFAQFWNPKNAPKTDLVVMRCVLPHIEEPWTFLDQIAKSQPSALVLIEFQRLEWILDTHCWYQFCHDHVNQFSQDDFRRRYEVLLDGQFANGEWGWVLIDPKLRRLTEPIGFEFAQDLQALLFERAIFLEQIKRTSAPHFVWGGAAKGTVLSDALHQIGRSPEFVFDANPRKQWHFLEGSGVQVLPPDEFARHVDNDSILWIANPNHVAGVKDYLGDVRGTVTSPSLN